jgi:hypothetical protein
MIHAALDAPPPIVRRGIPRQADDAYSTEGEGAQSGESASPRGARCQLLAHTFELRRVQDILLRLLAYEPAALWPRRLAIGRRGPRAGPGSQLPLRARGGHHADPQI